MLVIVAVTVSLSVVALYGIAKTAEAIMKRLGLDLPSVLLWFGLAERPTDA